MANTYTQFYIHIAFAVEDRQNLIKKENKDGKYPFKWIDDE